MSAPIVAGAAALYLQVNPHANPLDVMNIVMEHAVEETMSNLQGESPNVLVNIAGLVKGVQFDPEEVILVYEENIVQDVNFNISLSFTPDFVVGVTLTLSNALIGVISPTSVTYGPGNWSTPTSISFVPRTTVFPVGRTLMVVATLESDGGDTLTHGLRLIDSNFSRLGDTIDNPISIASIPYYGLMQSAMYSDTLRTECNKSATVEWRSPDIVLEFIPSRNGTITVDMCDSHVPTKLVVFNSTPVDGGNPIVCESAVSNCGFRSQMSRSTFDIESGRRYSIVADGFNGSAGLITIRISEENGQTILAELPPSSSSPDDSTTEPVYHPGGQAVLGHLEEKKNHGVLKKYMLPMLLASPNRLVWDSLQNASHRVNLCFCSGMTNVQIAKILCDPGRHVAEVSKI